MVFVYCMDGAGNKAPVIRNGLPAIFDSTDTAWELIERTMQKHDHPRFMWVKELEIPEDVQHDGN